ncbi:MAG: alpha-glucan family phosphorylase [Marinilabiliaceae bacterium]|jgi:phosphorylase/glycogen(starch) synthase|nr:alpha-glucan family phosphorylase [Marinilabiliaceae bacterium]
MKNDLSVDLLFETSWEICNKVGGIHTVISTKALNIVRQLGDNYILIGPDVWRNDSDNPEFIPDNTIFDDWVDKAHSEGLRVRTGRWNIEGKPVVILVDFTQYFEQKNEIFARLWESYRLDSLSGEWDYMEPALFGYSAARLIESFTGFYNQHQDIIAQFHEWMTGCGVLYLKSSAPWVSTAFTTHATVLGRSIAGNNRPLYSKLKEFNAYQLAREFNVQAKVSLEKISANEADVFTTVSDITSLECSAFLDKPVDIVTPNGFEDNFVPSPETFAESRAAARKKLLEVASVVCGEEMPPDSFLVITSGRYEYLNKGIDVYINALKEAESKLKKSRKLLAFITVPAYHKGPRKDLADFLEGRITSFNSEEKILTHTLHDRDNDPVIRELHSVGLSNEQGSAIKVIFVPSYLNGSDGIFNMPYFDLLAGFDLSIFPSYYEPWGYTPLESLMFSVPTVTTTLAGFGMWVRDHYKKPGKGILVVDRNDSNRSDVITNIAAFIADLHSVENTETDSLKKEAHEISRIATWDKLVQYYYRAYALALEKSAPRKMEPRMLSESLLKTSYIARKPHEKPVWKDMFIESNIPDKLLALKDISMNLWWSWNPEAKELFSRIDPSLWEETSGNPVMLLSKVDYKRLKVLSDDKEFLGLLDKVYKDFTDYISAKPDEDTPAIAYFSMEYGLHHTLKIYSGGLGVLAGDYLKEASDSNKNITAVGLLYRYGYFRQQLDPSGRQMAVYDLEDFSALPLKPVADNDGNHMSVSLVWPGRTVKAKIWLLSVGRIKLYLLDTDLEENTPEDRKVTHTLYGGDNENRLKQELILGIGGIRALRVLGVKPDLYHSNEGHSAFIGLERIHFLMLKRHLTFDEALEAIRSTTLFTTHTPVPAGHDSFDEELLRKYIPHYAERLKITWEKLMSLGRIENDHSGKFNMSYLAVRLSQEVNGVSKLHGEVSRSMLNVLWPGYLKEELFIGYVTNGVHTPTWISANWKKTFDTLCGESGFNQRNRSDWEKIHQLPDEEVYRIKLANKKVLFNWIRTRIRSEMIDRRVSPRQLTNIDQRLNPEVLTIGFARRFATYKRATLLFRDLDRLDSIINNPVKPVQLLFAGKAHPHDGAGQDLIARINEISQMPRFEGKIVFLENYDMDMATMLVSGVDIWLNTPTRPLEASGTSGEKAVMNGTLHFSVLDGWWVEGYRAYAGFALPLRRTFASQDLQDTIDAETIYNMLESEIIPAYYNVNDRGIPTEWTAYIKNSIAKIAPEFTMCRMIDDYYERFYNKLWERSKKLKENDYSKCTDLSTWKNWMRAEWPKLEILSQSFDRPDDSNYKTGKVYRGKVILNTHSIPSEYVGVEFVITKGTGNKYKFVSAYELKRVSEKDGKALYELEMTPEKAGKYFYGLRIFPMHPDLPHRQDFYLLRWID